MKQASSKPQISPERARAVLHYLHMEWASARDIHPHGAAIRDLKPPVFALHSGTSVWGRWSPEKREISLSETLVAEHPWDAVRDVLSHEMAHQMAHEIYGAVNETAHGPAFLRACDVLGADPKASGSFPTLRQRLERDADPSDDALTSRIKKLFALAGSSNPHESEAALAKAKHLMEKHQIETLGANVANRAYTTIFLGRAQLRHHREFYALAHFLIDHCFVRCIWAISCVLDKGKMGRVLEVSGSAPQVLAAEYTYFFILGAIDRAWVEVCREAGKNLGRYRKSDFALGMIEGFSQKLSREKAEGSSAPVGETLPDIVRDPMLDNYLQRRYPRITNRVKQGRNINPEFIDKGREEGLKLNLSPGVGETSQKRRLIE